MTVDPPVLPGLLLLALELLALAAVGFIVARVALRQADDRMALAQGMVIGPAVWGLTVNFMLFVVPGRAGAIVGWVVVLALAFGLINRAPKTLLPRPRTVVGFVAATLALFWVILAARQLMKIPDQAFIWACPLISRLAAGRQPHLGTRISECTTITVLTCLLVY